MKLLSCLLLLFVVVCGVDGWRIAFLGRWSCRYNEKTCPQDAYQAQSFYLGLTDGGMSKNGSFDKADVNIEFIDPQNVVEDLKASDMGGIKAVDNGRNTKAALELILKDSSKEPLVGVVGLAEDCNAVASLAAAYHKTVLITDCSVPVGEASIPVPGTVQMDKTQGAKYRALVQFLVANNWYHVGIVNLMSWSTTLYSGLLLDALAAQNIHVAFFESRSFSMQSGQFTGLEEAYEVVLKTYQQARIFILLSVDGNELKFMVAMQQMGLLETGKYFFLVVSSDDADDYSFWQFSSTRSTMKNNFGSYFQYPPEYILMLYRHMFYVTHVPDMEMLDNQDWLKFADKLKPTLGKTQCPPFCDRDDQKMANNTMSATSPYDYTKWSLAYDAGRLLAAALQENVQMNISDSSQLVDRLKSQNYTNVLGYANKFDVNGIAMKKIYLWSPQFPSTKASIYSFASIAGTIVPDEDGYYVVDMEDLNVRGVFNGGKLPEDRPPCGFGLEFCPQRNGLSTIEIVIIAVSAVIALVLIVAVVFLVRWIAYERRLESSYYILTRQDVQLQDLTRLASSRMGSDIYTSVLSIKSTHLQDLEQSGHAAGTMQFYQQNIRRAYRRRPRKLTKSAACRNDLWKEIVDWHLAKLDTHLVTVRKVNKDNVKLTRDMKQELDLLMTCVHENLNRFHGIIVEPSLVFTVHSFGLRKSLNDLLRNSDLRLDRMFKVSFVDDVTHGLRFLHDKCKIGYHGNLKSSNCVVDAYWRVKLSNFGLRHIRHGEPPAMADDLLWTAPELLRLDEGGLEQLSVADIASADLYSLGIILYEIYGRQGPYGDDLLDSNEILTQLKFPMLESLTRPDIQLIKKAPTPLLDVIQECWKEDPSERPSIKKIRDKLKPLKKGLKGNIADNIMELLDRYRYNLEDVIKERTEELEDERRRNERLLLQLLPGSVADSLKNGRPVEAEFFDAVTIYFSDIVGFTALSSKSSPMQVVTMLNDLYTEFDQIIDCFDCYKVETIGDAYMYVSGLPSLNGINHAGEVASASWQLLQCIKTFTVRHCPEERLRLRIGLHTGPVVTGVVGVRMPRYCLFGDTVITASNMESSGEPMKIQLSMDTFKLLSECRGYEMQLRGEVQLKNHKMTSYWLHGYSMEARLKRLESDQLKYPQLGELLEKASRF